MRRPGPAAAVAVLVAVVTLFAPFLAVPAGAAEPAWNIDRIGAPASASGTVIAVVDTGVDAAHPVFGGRVQPVIDLIGGGPGDPNGHGTHVAGVAAGGDSSAAWGVAAPGGDTSGVEGRDILSAFPDRRCALHAGTSMAAPHVSGALAALRAVGLGPQQAVDHLLSTARPIGSASTYGHGLVDLRAALGAPPAPTRGVPPTSESSTAPSESGAPPAPVPTSATTETTVGSTVPEASTFDVREPTTTVAPSPDGDTAAPVVVRDVDGVGRDIAVSDPTRGRGSAQP